MLLSCHEVGCFSVSSTVTFFRPSISMFSFLSLQLYNKASLTCGVSYINNQLSSLLLTICSPQLACIVERCLIGCVIRLRWLDRTFLTFTGACVRCLRLASRASKTRFSTSNHSLSLHISAHIASIPSHTITIKHGATRSWQVKPGQPVGSRQHGFAQAHASTATQQCVRIGL
jgi:hypothetical protein